MVLKTKKPGFTDLNTGRTLRSNHHFRDDRRYAFVRCTTTASIPDGRSTLTTRLIGVCRELPPNGVEYSLNKKCRWNIADHIRDDLLPLTADVDCQVKLFEHHHRPAARYGSSCIAFHSNAGQVLHRTSCRYMNTRSIAGETSGHVSNRQRRRLIRRGKSILTAASNSASSCHNQLVCDVVHAVPSSSSAFHSSRQYVPKSRKRVAPRSKGRAVSEEMQQAMGLPLRLPLLVRGRALDDAYFCQDDVPEFAVDFGIDESYATEVSTDDVYSGQLPLPPSSHSAPLLVYLADALSLTQSTKRQRKRGADATNRDDRSPHDAGSCTSPQATVLCATAASCGKPLPTTRSSFGSGLCSCSAADVGEVRSTALLPPDVLHIASCSGLLPAPDSPSPPTISIQHDGGCEGIGRQLHETFPQWRFTDCRCQPAMVILRPDCVAPANLTAEQDCPRPDQCSTGRTEACLVVQQLCNPATYCVWLAVDWRQEAVPLPGIREGSTYSLEQLLAAAKASLSASAYHGISRKRSSIASRSTADGSASNYGILSTERGWTVASKSLTQTYKQLQSTKLVLQNQATETVSVVLTLPQRRTCCGVCLTDTTSLNARAFALSKCGHIFCFGCWRAYLFAKVNGGSTVLQCPEYQCSTLVDYALILATCGLSIAERYRDKKMEAEVRKQLSAVWCPNQHCSRLLSLHREGQRTGSGGERGEPASAACACGSSTCFGCLAEAHWPLTCRQAAAYHSRLMQQGLYIVSSAAAFFSAVQVSTKPCPACRYPIEKSEGCQHIHCTKCSTDFCWGCVAILPGDTAGAYAHLNNCQVDVKARDEEFSAALIWPRRSLLGNRAIRHRAYRSAATAQNLRSKIALLAARAKPLTLSEYAATFGCDVPAMKYTETLKGMERHLRSVVVAFKLEAHAIIECSMVCLELEQRAERCPAGATRMQLRSRALAEVGRLEFILDRLQDLVEHFSDPCSPRPTFRHLASLDSLSASGKQKLCSLVRIMTAYQGY